MSAGPTTILIGCGTGRCGSTSLARLVGASAGAHCTHERRPLMPWVFSQELFDERVRYFSGAPTSIIGDVAYYYLPYLDRLLDALPAARVICMRRDREQMIRSFMEWTRWRNHWYDHDGTEWVRDHVWDATHPKFDIPDKQQALGAYWDDYYRQIGLVAEAHPGRVQVIELTEINTRAGQERVLDFLEVPGDRRRYPEKEPRHNLGAVAERATTHEEAADWMSRAVQCTEEIRNLIPSDESLILVDEEKLRDAVVAGRRAFHFIERNGKYHGPPENDAAAIVELERLQGTGARFVVFAWPAFWWLDHYTGLHEHLRSTAECVLCNERLVVFDLGAR